MGLLEELRYPGLDDAPGLEAKDLDLRRELRAEWRNAGHLLDELGRVGGSFRHCELCTEGGLRMRVFVWCLEAELMYDLVLDRNGERLYSKKMLSGSVDIIVANLKLRWEGSETIDIFWKEVKNEKRK
jgi:hypothetical protein